MDGMSEAVGEKDLRFMALKNIFSDGYIQFPDFSSGGTSVDGKDLGSGVVVEGDMSARGIVLVTLSVRNPDDPVATRPLPKVFESSISWYGELCRSF